MALYVPEEEGTACAEASGEEGDCAAWDVDCKINRSAIVQKLSKGEKGNRKLLLTGAEDGGTTLPVSVTVQPLGRPG